MIKWFDIIKQKTCIGLFVLAFILAGIFIVENCVAHAENAPYVDASTDFISEEKVISTDGVVPVASGEYADWLFAGWYSEQTCKDESVISNTTVGATAWAKFVPADVLTVKCQVKSDVQSEGITSTNMRLITSVDTLNYNKVGFKVIYNNGAEKDIWTQTVYSRIKASAESGVDYKYSPKVVDTKSEWFVTATLININKNNYNNTFLIKPYWVTYDGTVVYGQSRYVTVTDSYSNVVNLPVKVDSEATLKDLTVAGESIKETRYSENGAGWGAIVLTEEKSALPSLTKYSISDGQVAYWRNLDTVYNGSNADKSWYEAISDEKEFVIATSADLYGMSVLANPTNKITFGGKTIYLCADIEANKGKATSEGWDKTQVENGTDYIWTPIGRTVGEQDGAVFNGIFDGQGHTISGIYAELTTAKCGSTGTENGTALFAWTDSRSVLKDFQLVNCYLGGTTFNASIVSRAAGQIDNVDSNAIVKGSSYINGGIVANTYGKIQIKDCNFTGNVSSVTNFAGGIVGTRKKGDLSLVNCSVEGTVCAPKFYSGGILGGIYDNLDDATIKVDNCRFTGNLENTNGHSGGIIGSAYNKQDIINVTNCFVGGTINVGELSGGFMGQVGGGHTTITDSDYAGKLTTSGNCVGGLVGKIIGGSVDIENSNYAGKLTTSGYYAGGFVGYIDNGSVDIENSNFEETGKVEADQTAGGLVGYAMGGTVTIDNSSAAGEVASNWSTGGLVSRVANGTVEIKNSSFAETGKVTKGNYSGGFIGRVESGTVNIDYCHADSMTAPGSYSGGIIGYIASGNATVENTYFQGTFNTTAENAGGLVGYILKGTLEIEKSYFDGDFTSTTNYAGGIVGTIGAVSSGCDVTVDIKSCYAKGTVSAKGSHIGGIVGRVTYLTNKTVLLMDCLNAASVSGGNWTGGLFGRTHKTSGTIKMTRCLNMGTINSSSSTSAGSAVGGADQAPTVDNVYAVINNTVSKTCGNNTFAVTTCELKDITVGNGVTVEKIQSETLKGLFATENSIWTIETTEGSTPKLNLATQ